MKIHKQSEINPYLYSDSNKRYYTYDYYLRHTYGEKCAKISLDAGLTCPNIDGRCGIGGCIYCSPSGSGDFTAGPSFTLTEQYQIQQDKVLKKWKCRYFIPYLQSHTNTYAPIHVLKRIFEEVIHLPGAVALHIATRADCLSEEVLYLLSDVSKQIDLTVELGLQTIHDRVANLINRGHTFRDFCDGFLALRSTSDRIRIGVHLINGLPTETLTMMLESAQAVGELHPDLIKFHLLHVLKNTKMADLYTQGNYIPMSEEDYVSVIVRQLERIPQDIVIGRITGDGREEDLLAPKWSLKKFCVMNLIDRKMFLEDTWQGKYVSK